MFGKDLPDFWKAEFENMANEIHGDLARQRDRSAVGPTLEIRNSNTIVLSDKADDVGRICSAIIGQEFEQGHTNDVHRNLGIFELGVRYGPIEGGC